jgi:hypothetical protein
MNLGDASYVVEYDYLLLPPAIVAGWYNADARPCQSDENLVNSSATVGTEPAGI